MQGDFKSPVAEYQKTVCERYTEEHYPPFSGLNKREELFCYILYCSYCLLHLQNSKRRFQNLLYVTTFYIQYWAVARFVLKQ